MAATGRGALNGGWRSATHADSAGPARAMPCSVIRVTDFQVPSTHTCAFFAKTEQLMQSTNDAEFKAAVLESTLPVLVDFWAPWCAPCRALAPVLEELDGELAGKVKIVKVNVDENGIVAGQLGIRSIPTVVVFKDGQAVEGAVGALSKGELIALLGKHVAVAAQG